MEEGKYNHGATKMAEVINEKKTKAKNWISDIVLPVQSDDVEEEKMMKKQAMMKLVKQARMMKPRTKSYT